VGQIKIKKSAKLSISVEASSPVSLDKPLEQALFELKINTFDDNS